MSDIDGALETLKAWLAARAGLYGSVVVFREEWEGRTPSERAALLRVKVENAVASLAARANEAWP